MAKKILTVGCEIPGGFGKYVGIDSKASLLDADIALFYPTLVAFSLYSMERFNGKPRLPDASSFRVQDAVSHWKRELVDALNAGNTVVIILCELEHAYVSTGEKQHSGTGRNRITTNIVRPLTNYDLLPLAVEVVESRGTSMALTRDGNILSEYWRQFGTVSQYRVYFRNSDTLQPKIVTRQGDRVVGGILQTKSGGALVALPWIDLQGDEDFAEEYEDDDGEIEYRWTPKALEWGQKYLEALVSLDSTLKSQSKETPIPQWVLADIYATKSESELTEKLLGVQSEISKLEKERADYEIQIGDAGWLKALLYEQGHALESAVLQAMRLLGFEASNFRNSDSEFDAVLECLEGRCIGEVEGRDNKAIDINKMRQLIVNIQEDFSREEVAEYAKGILFGNAHRLTPSSDRPAEHFTPKCVKAAAANGIALIRTCDLFEVARALIDNPDEAYAAECRQAIFDAKGKEVGFPAAPGTTKGEPGKRTRTRVSAAKGIAALS